jgi:hypothetical protein
MLRTFSLLAILFSFQFCDSTKTVKLTNEDLVALRKGREKWTAGQYRIYQVQQLPECLDEPQRYWH